jgi:hypothetical protein
MVSLGALLAGAAWSQASPPFDVGDRAQLFVDQFLVRDAEGVAFTLHPAKKHPGNPLMQADQPWEGGLIELYGSVLYDGEEKRFKMWYVAAPSEYFEHEVVCYATSVDGIRWEKPHVGTLRARNGKPHNAVTYAEIASVIKDSRNSDPKQRYKMICFIPNEGYQTQVSADGLTWVRASTEPIAQIAHIEDVVTGYWDERLQRYVAFCKLQYPVRGRLRRCFWVVTSLDFKHWTKLELVFAPDERDDAGTLFRLEEVRPMLRFPDRPKVMRTEFYGAGAYVAESCTIAFPWVFTINSNIPEGNQDGPMEVQLASSRDLLQWERPFRKPCIARGKVGDWDSGLFVTASEAIRVGDEIRLYYCGTNCTHGAAAMYEKGNKQCTGRIGLASWPLDRFVSVDGPSDGGTLTTIPVRFTGKRLEINAATKQSGKIVVELLDAAGRPIDGVMPSEPVLGDAIRQRVRFSGDVDFEKLANRPICLRFHLHQAELYSFAFRK